MCKGNGVDDPELDFEKRFRLAREVLETLVLTTLMFFVIRLAVQNFNVDGHSMEPNLHNAELILVDKWTYLFHPPSRGDIIVFVAPPQPDQDYVKRIIGLPGDEVTVQDTHVYVNGKYLNETYVSPDNQGNPYPSFTNRQVPLNAYLVLGDNRGGSSDSRDWGCVPRQNIIGRAALVYWPFGQDNNGLLPNVSSVFDAITAPATPPGDVCSILTQPRNAQSRAVPSDKNFNVNTVLLLLMPGMFVVCARRRRSG
jgi:signal peptidase I